MVTLSLQQGTGRLSCELNTGKYNIFIVVVSWMLPCFYERMFYLRMCFCIVCTSLRLLCCGTVSNTAPYTLCVLFNFNICLRLFWALQLQYVLFRSRWFCTILHLSTVVFHNVIASSLNVCNFPGNALPLERYVLQTDTHDSMLM